MTRHQTPAQSPRQKGILGLSAAELLILLVLCSAVVVVLVGGLVIFAYMTLGGSIQAPVAASSSPGPANNTSAIPTEVQQFANSNFCQKYRCTRYGIQTIGGITGYYFRTALSVGTTETQVYFRPNGAVEYDLGLQPVSASGVLEDSKVQWEDPQAAFDYLQSLFPDVPITDEMKSKIKHDLLQHLNQICDTTPISLGKYKAWIGRVAFYQQDVIVATTCPK